MVGSPKNTGIGVGPPMRVGSVGVERSSQVQPPFPMAYLGLAESPLFWVRGVVHCRIIECYGVISVEIIFTSIWCSF